ncbi:MAG: zinc-dependent alcohol dehydrogenase family protein [Flammeovirgaceae bacterium]|nr:MAG: zinc-dependent alcohol dehydrogenase family protein [Flammeovirgaceae bacterium]
MKAWLLHNTCNLADNDSPLTWSEVPTPVPATKELLIKISCCGVCHTELDEIEGRTPPPMFPVIPGHQVVGTVAATGMGVTGHKAGDRVGVAWIFAACGVCNFCLKGEENLCPAFKATGRDAHGGYAEYLTVNEKFAYGIPDFFTDVEAAPLLCAGAIGYRALRLTNLTDGDTLGLTGFGASGHLVLKLAKALYPNSHVLVFARSRQEQEFARTLGAEWAGHIDDVPPEKATAIIDTTPVWKPVLASLKNLVPGGRVVINAIRKEETDKAEMLALNYPEHLWMEKEIKSVANITSADVREFLELAARHQISPEVESYPMQQANRALLDIKHKHIRGAKVLTW